MCTAISFNSGKHYFGRNLDVEHSYNEYVTVIPRKFPIKYRFEEEEDRNHLAVIGMACVIENYPLLYDGINEEGLGVAGLNFTGYAKYNDLCEGKTNIAGFELPLWLLSKCKSVDDAERLLRDANITATDYNEILKSARLHWMICDKKRCAVLELTDEGTKLWDNPTGVMANDPPLDFHMTNLRRYLNLTAAEVESRFSGDVKLKPITRGAGAIGLPGDYTSSSRFVRCAFVKANSVKPKNEGMAVEQFFRILDSVSVPDGCVRLKECNERTEYTSCMNTDEGIYYYKTYENSRIRAVKMANEELDSNELYTYPIAKPCDFLYLN